MPEYPVLREATFDPKLRTYWILAPLVPMVFSIVLIPAIPVFWFIAHFLIDKYIANLGCVLTSRTLEVRKGLFNRIESTIPLEKITDLQMFQGPIMRYFGLYGFKVETAGQTNVGGALLSMVGIQSAPAFRRAVLDQRDVVSDRSEAGPSPGRLASGEIQAELAGATPILTEIRDALLRIEQRMDRADKN